MGPEGEFFGGGIQCGLLEPIRVMIHTFGPWTCWIVAVNRCSESGPCRALCAAETLGQHTHSTFDQHRIVNLRPLRDSGLLRAGKLTEYWGPRE